MFVASLAVAFALQQAPAPEDPTQIISAATRAVEMDSAAAVSRQWSARLRRDSTDRAAELGLATIARLTNNFTVAERRYTHLIGLAGPAPDRYTVYARLGRMLAQRTLPPAAEEEFGRALADAEALSDSAASVQVLFALASVRTRTRGAPAAESVLARAALVLPAGNLRLAAQHRCTRASVRSIAISPETRSDAEAGAELAQRAGAPRIRATCRYWLGIYWQRVGEFEQARVAFLDAAEDYRRVRDRGSVAEILYRLSEIDKWAGDYGQASAHLHASLAESRASNRTETEAGALVELAYLSLRQWDVPAALRYAASARQIYGESAGASQRVRLHYLDGEVARMAGRLDEARAEQERALSYALRVGSGQQILSVRWALADLAMASGDFATAQRELDSCEAVIRAQNMTGWLRELTYPKAVLAMLRGDLETAQRGFEQTIEGAETPFVLHRNRARLAEVLARRGDLGRAESELVAAVESLDAWRARLGDRELRVSVFQLQEDRVDNDLGIATVLAQMAAAGRTEAAFNLAERGRARDLLDQLLRAEALRSRTGGTGTGDHAPDFRPVLRAATVDEVRAAIPDERTAVLQYVTGRGGEPTTVFVVRRSGIAAHRLAPIDSLTDPVARFVQLVASGGDASALSATLGSALLDPIAAGLDSGVVRLIIIPDDVLHRVPFDALKLADGRYAVERFAISVAPSASVVVRLWKRPPPAPAAVGTLLAFGDPEFGTATAAGAGGEGGVAYRSAFDESGGLPRLRESGREARAVARHALRSAVRLRGEASEAFLKRTPLDGYRVLHFATHALVDERTATRTALVLAPGGGEDGFVGPGDVAALRLNADLVVLSACRTAGGVLVRGEGIQGLTAPFIEAGAASVVASQWRVADRSTASFMEAFYRELAGSRSVGDALRAAKLDALKRGAPAAEWAAFTLVGDPLVRPLAP